MLQPAPMLSTSDPAGIECATQRSSAPTGRRGGGAAVTVTASPGRRRIVIAGPPPAAPRTAMVLPNSARPPGRGADRQRGPARLRRWPSSGRPGETRLPNSSTPTPGWAAAASRTSSFQRVTRPGWSSGNRLPSSCSPRRLKGSVASRTLAPSAADDPDGAVQLCRQVGVVRRVSEVGPPAAQAAVHGLPAADEDDGDVGVVRCDGLPPPSFPHATLGHDGCVGLPEVPVRRRRRDPAAQAGAVPYVELVVWGEIGRPGSTPTESPNTSTTSGCPGRRWRGAAGRGRTCVPGAIAAGEDVTWSSPSRTGGRNSTAEAVVAAVAPTTTPRCRQRRPTRWPGRWRGAAAGSRSGWAARRAGRRAPRERG